MKKQYMSIDRYCLGYQKCSNDQNHTTDIVSKILELTPKTEIADTPWVYLRSPEVVTVLVPASQSASPSCSP